MMWKYNGLEVSLVKDMPDNTIGFIYIITNLIHNRIYIGKKYIAKGKNWLTYYGSSNDLKLDIALYGKQAFRREILKYCSTNINMTYYEVHYQCNYNVLTTDSYNKAILGKFYKGRVTA